MFMTFSVTKADSLVAVAEGVRVSFVEDPDDVDESKMNQSYRR